MMLDHLGFSDAHDAIIAAIETVLREDAHLTPDMGGQATTRQLGRAVADALS
jgi:tartrate dehydrogenase/decarboxylase/D-malate dehydrogenase